MLERSPFPFFSKHELGSANQGLSNIAPEPRPTSAHKTFSFCLKQTINLPLVSWLLSPRSALGPPPPPFTRRLQRRSIARTHACHMFGPTATTYIIKSTLFAVCQCPFFLLARFKKDVSARSIFSAKGFVREVVTHFLADSDFHGHRPDVLIPSRLFDG